MVALTPTGAVLAAGIAVRWSNAYALIALYVGLFGLAQGVLLATHRCATALSGRYAKALGATAIVMIALAATPLIGTSVLTSDSKMIYVIVGVLCSWLSILGHEGLLETPYGNVDPDVFS